MESLGVNYVESSIYYDHMINLLLKRWESYKGKILFMELEIKNNVKIKVIQPSLTHSAISILGGNGGMTDWVKQLRNKT